MYSRKALVLLISLMLSTFTHAGYKVIVNAENNLNSINKRELKQIYLKKVKTFPNGAAALPVGVESNNIRKAFLDNVLNKSESSLNSYWSRLMFTGRGTPPKLFKNDQQAIDFVRANKSAFAFISESTVLHEGVKELDVQ